MNKIFPPMYSKPEKIQIFALIPCWVWVFVLLPMFMPFLDLGLWEQTEDSVWLEIGYHVSNGILMLLLMFSYFKEDWFMVTIDWRNILKHVLLTVGLILGAELTLMILLLFGGFNIGYIIECLPVAEMFVSHTPLLLVDLEPIFGTVVMSVFVPISICSLFYCLGFAPICNKNPILAYLCIAAITLIPPIVNILWRGDSEFFLSGYLAHLPIHLLTCWSYQKTDNVWTPLMTLTVTNLLLSILLPILFPISMYL